MQQEIKVDLLHTVCKHCLHSKDHTSTLKRGVTTYYILHESALLRLHAGENQKSVSFVIRVQQRIKVDLLHSVNKNHPTSTPYSSKTKAVSPPQMLPKRSSNASALVQSKSQVRRPLCYGATGVQSHPILVTVTACRLWPTSAPKRRPAIDPKRDFTTLFHSNSRNTMAVLSSGSPWMKESPVKMATRHSIFHAHVTSLFLEWKSAHISVLHLLCIQPLQCLHKGIQLKWVINFRARVAGLTTLYGIWNGIWNVKLDIKHQ